MTCGLVYSEECLEHHPGWFHPERPERLTAIRAGLEDGGLWGRCRQLPAREATDEEILAVHTPEHLSKIRKVHEQGGGVLDIGDTVMSEGSMRAALMAAGGCVDAAAAVARGELSTASALIRPPGHHAESGRAMGFCIFNNVAIAARSLQRVHGFQRLLIFDWDEHHGNGTQEIFWRDGGVFYVSLHRWPFYPGTGSADETGEGPGENTTLNFPLPASVGIDEYMRLASDAISGPITDFAPEFVMISAGFDSHADESLGGMCLKAEHFAEMTRMLKALPSAGGRVCSVLEGGYELRSALPDSVAAHVSALLD